jgi:hypothetical protein
MHSPQILEGFLTEMKAIMKTTRKGANQAKDS